MLGIGKEKRMQQELKIKPRTELDIETSGVDGWLILAPKYPLRLRYLVSAVWSLCRTASHTRTRAQKLSAAAVLGYWVALGW
jgi:hypothetical protein